MGFECAIMPRMRSVFLYSVMMAFMVSAASLATPLPCSAETSTQEATAANMPCLEHEHEIQEQTEHVCCADCLCAACLHVLATLPELIVLPHVSVMSSAVIAGGANMLPYAEDLPARPPKNS